MRPLVGMFFAYFTQIRGIIALLIGFRSIWQIP